MKTALSPAFPRSSCFRHSQVAPPTSLTHLPLDPPKPVRVILERLDVAGKKAYVVGGAVRDVLLGFRGHDWDVCTDASPEEVGKLFDWVKPAGVNTGTVSVFSDRRDPNPVHVSSLRFYVGHEHLEPKAVRFQLGHDLEQDLNLRDFTINAIAWDPKTSALIDPTGGRRDLEDKTIRAIGDAKYRFLEDPRRMLRALRFSGRFRFQVDPSTLDTITECSSWILQIRRQRVRNELLQILGTEDPTSCLELMRTSRIMTRLLPELVACRGIKRDSRHSMDIYEHSLRTCALLPVEKPELRLAGLLHDIGKSQTRETEGHGRWSFNNHETVGADLADGILRRWRFRKPQCQYVINLIRHHGFVYASTWSEADIALFIDSIAPRALEDLFALRVADVTAAGKRAPDLRSLDELHARVNAVLERRKPPVLAINGNDVITTLGIKGPRVGRVLKAVATYVLADLTRNSRDELMAKLQAGDFTVA